MNQTKQKDLYEILGVAKDATLKEIKAAYYRLAKIYHPDTGDAGDAEKFTELSAAYETLRKNKSRKKYDAEGGVTFTEAEQNVLAIFLDVFSNMLGDYDYDSSRIVEIVIDRITKLQQDLVKRQHSMLGKQAILSGMPILHRGVVCKHNLVKMAKEQTLSMIEQELLDIDKGTALLKEMETVARDFLGAGESMVDVRYRYRDLLRGR